MEAAALPTSAARSRGRFLRGGSDADLVARLRAGDDTAFEAIYDRHHRGLFAFCRHMLGSREEAEDAVQHVFIAVHRNLREGTEPVALKAWLYAVARNRSLNMLAARRERSSLDDVPEPSTDGLAVAGAVERRQDLRALLRDMAGLPDDQRAALLLAELGDLSHDEIAGALGVRREKVKALVFQARTSLMNMREAREADCRAIQEQLATMRGADLRRVTLRKHVAMCPACAAFKAEVRRQRAAMALVLPVLPAAALKGSVFSAVFGGGGAAGGAAVAAGGAGGAAGTAGIVKALAVLAAVGGVGGGTVVAVHQLERHHAHRAPATVRSAPAPAPAQSPAAAQPSAAARRHAARHAAAADSRASAVAKGHSRVPATGSPAGEGPAAGDHGRGPAHGQSGASHGLAVGHRTHPSHAGGAKAHTPARRPVVHHVRPAHPVHPAHPARPAPARTQHHTTTTSSDTDTASTTQPPSSHGKSSTVPAPPPSPTADGSDGAVEPASTVAG